jgi:hypothetical protein
MSEKKIVAPKGMRVAVVKALMERFSTTEYHPRVPVVLEASLRWLDEKLKAETLVYAGTSPADDWREGWKAGIDSVRRMFLAPEDDFERDCGDLQVHPVIGQVNGAQINDRIRQAYERGKANRKGQP